DVGTGDLPRGPEGGVEGEGRTRRGGGAARGTAARARPRDSMRAFKPLSEEVDGELRIASDPPLVVPLEDLVAPGRLREESEAAIHGLLESYRQTLAGLHHPIEEFRYVHTARKVVG